MSLLAHHRRLPRRARRADRGPRVRPLPRRAPVRREGAALLGRLRPAAVDATHRHGPDRVGDRGDPARRLREDARRARRRRSSRTRRDRAFNRQSVVAALRHRASPGRWPISCFAIAGLRGLFMYGLPEARPVLGAPPRGHARPRPRACAPATRCARSTASRSRPGRSCAGACCRRRCSAQPLRLEVVDERGHLARRDARPARLPADDVDSDFLRALGLRLYRPPLEPVIGQVVRRRRRGARRASRRATASLAPTASRSTTLGRAGRRGAARSPGKPLRARRRARRRARTTCESRPTAVERGQKRIGRIGAAPQMPPAHAERMIDPRAARPARERCGKALDKTWDIVGLQPEDARQDARGRSVVEEPVRAGHDRRLRRPVGADGLDLVPDLPRADQHQPRRAQPAADPAAGWRAPDVLCRSKS